ncbi:two-component system sensor histidine kinase VicK [Bacillus mesophilus]|uniref:histidine kinase n=1 Tax=Bacillus mesophilus TaxID=1808955 RepID=A0A6M0Q9U6_9BACI|nr:cell wall metabolism sensor histidine kinase WalK [Bacillus mesophilus]MBM7662238.1 two-component system sensor histidine kinase VicK [Bacillus mesophilus]NEY73122.1 cell wall metabolism sensor histidine kinase WalK [Bacillus mesophilus]
MKQVGFFKSIHFKFVLIYVLLILIAMQIIGVYFVQRIEKQLVTNFSESLNERVDLLAYNLEQEMIIERDEKMPTLEVKVQSILTDFLEDADVRVIDKNSRVIGTTNINNQQLIGRRITDIPVKQALVAGFRDPGKVLIDQQSGHRMLVLTVPIKSGTNVLGVITLEASMESVYDQLKQINNIFVKGTVIALSITALLGIFLAQTITRPLSDMRKQALEMTKGNFTRKVKIYGYDEIGQLGITFNNLTKRLQEAQATTEGERRKLSSVLAYMTDGVIATDRKGRIILINDPAAEMLNVPRETVLAESVLTVLGIEDEYSLEQIIEDVDSLTLDFSTSQKPYILKVSFSVIQKETGLVNGLIAVLYDVTEQEKIEEERREFVANVSHELRTPLTTMRSYLEALAEGAWQDQEIAPRFLDVTQTETERMIRLVNDLLQLSKLDSKDYRFIKDWVHFPSYFNRIIDRFELTKNQNVTFIRNIPNQETFVEMDEDKITQVLDNIISNALKYSPEGGKIEFDLSMVNEESIKVCVTDQGVGIPKENINNVFDRFYRVDKARTRKLGGTGLGLAIAKEMVNAHGGEIWVESEEGIGTTICFTLPLDKDFKDDWE